MDIHFAMHWNITMYFRVNKMKDHQLNRRYDKK